MALPTVVSDFIEAVQDSLTTGSDLGQDLRGAAQNYLRAQDFASILELLQDEMTTSTELTATGGSTTTVVDGAATFTASEQVGNYVQFEADTTTAALRGLSFRILANSTTTLTVETMPAAAVAGDTYQIVGGLFEKHIEDLREGHSLGDAPRGSLLGEARVMLDALATGIRQLGGTLPERTISRPGLETAAGSSTTEVKLEMAGLTPRIDQFKGLKATIDGVVRSVVKSDEFGTLTVAPALASAPAAGVTVTLVVDELKTGSRDGMSGVVSHAGRQPGENAQLALMIGTLADLLDSYTLPA